MVAGIIGEASVTKNGLIPSGYVYGTDTRTLSQGESFAVGGIDGMFLFQDIASYGHWHLMFKAKGALYDLSGKAFGYMKLSVEGDNLVVTNSGTARAFTLIYQSVNIFKK